MRYVIPSPQVTLGGVEVPPAFDGIPLNEPQTEAQVPTTVSQSQSPKTTSFNALLVVYEEANRQTVTFKWIE